MLRRDCLSILLAAWAGMALADFVPDDQVVSDPASNLPQPEFDRATNRIIWQDRQNRLWIGGVDPVTGALNPTNGRGWLIDTGLAPVGQVQTTPRYTYGGDQAAIVYTKKIDAYFSWRRPWRSHRTRGRSRCSITAQIAGKQSARRRRRPDRR